ncbi:MAG: chemotaxis protein CheX [Deltaproteobacteria bacterium]|nr:chemotaxis protein CheX [Deltaproteobacteria bacterium]
MEQNKILRQNLLKAVFEVFEKMYYIFLEPVEGEAAGKDFSAVEIGFSGDIAGSIIARFPQELSMMMAANALGMDDQEMSDQILADCRRECLNMLCGNFLQKHNADKLFHMTLPKAVIGKGGSELDGQRQIYKLDLNFESGHIPLRVEMIIYQQQC